ncbi:hypothetical protein BG015_002144 [Linnemannia schmuckeri]|uniref:Uncharacterized protein n=1 Tax=Linnemannia schmuckeri TaxID=64567 RepID=A0A9P5S5W7_9FUNG|nr:hypothetical protein BG015_002144 [Linnemannia schmuckeri]
MPVFLSASSNRLDKGDYAKLANLQDLRLVQWDGSEGVLVQVLRTVARTLKELEMIDVVGFQELDLLVTSATKSVGGAAGGGVTELVLPCLTTLRVPCDPNNTDMAYLAGCSPNLEEPKLEVLVDEFDLIRLANTLNTRYLQLDTLAIHNKHDENEPGFSFRT